MEIDLSHNLMKKSQHLSEKLSDSFEKTTGHPKSIFGIRFKPYQDNEAAVGGKTLNKHQPNTPYIHILLYCPKLSLETKRTLVKSLTEDFCSVYDKNHWPIIHICEHSYDNVAIEGELLCDKFEELQNK
jgi:phenylpyruvate tautomerase PptA (4-oxalocrotonate tautomerase family)